MAQVNRNDTGLNCLWGLLNKYTALTHRCRPSPSYQSGTFTCRIGRTRKLLCRKGFESYSSSHSGNPNDKIHCFCNVYYFSYFRTKTCHCWVSCRWNRISKCYVTVSLLNCISSIIFCENIPLCDFYGKIIYLHWEIFSIVVKFNWLFLPSIVSIFADYIKASLDYCSPLKNTEKKFILIHTVNHGVSGGFEMLKSDNNTLKWVMTNILNTLTV